MLATTLPPFDTSARPQWQSALVILLAALVCLPWFDVELANTQPWSETKRLLAGLVRPQFAIDGLFTAIGYTLAVALQAVTAAALFGFLLANIYNWPGVTALMTVLRSVHEIFWALLILQVLGLSQLTGVLALAIPYAATFARVFAEILQETPSYPSRQIPGGNLSRFIFSTLPLAWPRLSTYFRYRLECALRASVVLGFVGLPTLGYLLEGYLKQGSYREVTALLMLFIGLVLVQRWWARGPVAWGLLLVSLWWLPPLAGVAWQPSLFGQLLKDFTPAPLRGEWSSDTLAQLWHWFVPLWSEQMLPGIANTLVLGQLALLLAGALALMWFPLVSPGCVPSLWTRRLGHGFLVVMRSLPEILLAFFGLIFFGPSLLPGVLALGLHNAAILAHLVGTYSGELNLRADAPTGWNCYFYELLPRLYGQFLSFTLYRWETILRETAILGMLGIPTLGFFIDSAFEDFRLDRAVLLIAASAVLNIVAERLAHWLRHRKTDKASQHRGRNPEGQPVAESGPGQVGGHGGSLPDLKWDDLRRASR